jgi:hypothetical protein
MTTYELLNILEEQFPGWNRDGVRGLLRYVDIAQKALCMVPAEQLLIMEDATGKLPVLGTTAGTFAYYMSAITSFVDEVLVEADSRSWGSMSVQSLQDYGRTAPDAAIPEYRAIAGIQYLRVPFVRTWPATDANNAKLLFTKDPATTTSLYYLRSYRRPETLDSDSIGLLIPPPYDELYLLPAAAKLVEGANHGNYIEARAAIERDFKPLMWEAFNEGEQGQSNEPESRGF